MRATKERPSVLCFLWRKRRIRTGKSHLMPICSKKAIKLYLGYTDKLSYPGVSLDTQLGDNVPRKEYYICPSIATTEHVGRFSIPARPRRLLVPINKIAISMQSRIRRIGQYTTLAKLTSYLHRIVAITLCSNHIETSTRSHSIVTENGQ